MNIVRIATLMALALSVWTGPAQAQDERISSMLPSRQAFLTRWSPRCRPRNWSMRSRVKVP